jgi:hypothetical protein
MARKKWQVEVRRTLWGTDAKGAPSEITPGRYRMLEEDEVTYRIGQSAHPVHLRIRQIINAKNAGDLLIEGRWP